jgi:glyoxylate/hydroxypyruvate reductase A
MTSDTAKIPIVYACAKEFERWQEIVDTAHAQQYRLVSMDSPDAFQAEIAIAWLPPQGYLASLPNLKVICSLGMGVNGIVDDNSIADDVQIVRLVDRSIIEQMVEYILGDVIRVRRKADQYHQQQQQSLWKRIRVPDARETIVTVLGVGEIGGAIAQAMAALHYEVRGWRNSSKALTGVKIFSGAKGLPQALSEANFIINVLPLTAGTENILNSQSLAGVAKDAHLINIARGAHLVEADLLEMLAQEKLGSATLDVTAKEPLAADHPFWLHPKIRITPHISGITYATDAAEQILQSIYSFQQGLPLSNVVDREQGY